MLWRNIQVITKYESCGEATLLYAHLHESVILSTFSPVPIVEDLLNGALSWVDSDISKKSLGKNAGLN